MNRTSLVLGLIALLLGGYVFFVERGTLSTGEVEKRKGSALPELIRERVVRLEIQRKGVTTVLARTLDDKPPSAEGTSSDTPVEGLWRVEAPYRAKADESTVDSLLGELEWFDARHKLGPVGAQDRARFGFDKPRVRVAFTVGKVRVKLAVGNDSPRGDGVYVMVGEPPEAFIAGKDFIEALNQEPGRYHDKELHDGMLVATTRAIAIRDAQGERALRKRDDGLWAMTAGADGLASEQTVTELVQALDGLRTQRFVADGVKDLARYGLASAGDTAPALRGSAASRFTFELRKAKLTGERVVAGKQPKREEITFTLRVGASCQGHPGESYVTVEGSGSVSCASDPDLEKLSKTATALRESRLLPVAEEDIKTVQLRRGGVQLSLTVDDDGHWTYALKGGGAGALQGKARDGAVSDWLKALSAAQVTRYDVPLPAALAQADALSIEVGRGSEKPALKLQAVLAGMDLIVRRADEPHAVAFASSTAALVTPDAARFRPLAVLQLNEPALRSIEITRSGVQERVTRAAGADNWALIAPQQLTPDNLIVSELARNLSALEAVRFETDSPLPVHGLATPAAIVTLEHALAGKPAQRTVIEIGAQADAGRFAQLRGQPGVFVMAARTASLLLDPLVSRSLLATPLERLRAVTLEHAGKRLQVTRSDTGFVAAAGSALSPDAARALADAVATLRASRVVAYGPPAANLGLQHPEIKLDITADSSAGAEQRYTVALGNPTDDGGRYAARNDSAVTFVLPKEACDRLLGVPATVPADVPPTTASQPPSHE